jgi:hypothetical protein
MGWAPEPVWAICKTVSGSCRIRNPESPARGLVSIPSSYSYKHMDHFKLKYFIQPLCNQRLLLSESIAMPQVLLLISKAANKPNAEPLLNYFSTQSLEQRMDFYFNLIHPDVLEY